MYKYQDLLIGKCIIIGNNNFLIIGDTVFDGDRVLCLSSLDDPSVIEIALVEQNNEKYSLKLIDVTKIDHSILMNLCEKFGG